MTQLLNILFSLSISIYVGSVIFFSFFTAPTLFRELPKEMAGNVVSKIFPNYYLLGYFTLIVAFISLTLRGIIEKPFPLARILLLLIMLGCTFYAGLSIQPKAHLMKTVIRTMEDSPEKQIKEKEFGELHKQSVYLNVASLLSGILVIILTAIRIY